MSKDAYIRQLQMDAINAGNLRNTMLEGANVHISIQNANKANQKNNGMSEETAEKIGSAIGSLVAPLKAAQEENAYFKEQLSRPLMEIINENKEYKDAFEKQREILEGWMVSQNAFKKLALEYGKKIGKDEDSVKEDMLIEEEKVISGGVITKVNGTVASNLRIINK